MWFALLAVEDDRMVSVQRLSAIQRDYHKTSHTASCLELEGIVSNKEWKWFEVASCYVVYKLVEFASWAVRRSKFSFHTTLLPKWSDTKLRSLSIS